MDLLLLLLQHPNDLVPRSEIIDRLWGGDVFVDVDTGINTAVRKLRQALGDSPESSAYVETVPGRGYRFVAPVEIVRAPRVTPFSASATIEPDPRPRSNSRRQWIALGVALVTVAGALASRGARFAVPSPVTLAVLPFHYVGNDPSREYLAYGLTEETSANLAQVDPERLRVKGRTLLYKAAAKTAAEIGRVLAVEYLLESTVQAEAGRIRVTPKLTRAADDQVVWSQSFDYEPASLLGLQKELSGAIATQVRLRFSPERAEAMARRQTRSPEAYDQYLRARDLAFQRTPSTTVAAVDAYERATRIDPDYALAWAGMAHALAASTLNSDAPPLAIAPRARAAAERAVRADPRLPDALFALAYIQWHLDWDWDAAETGFRRVLAATPDHAWAHTSLGHLLSQRGRHREARHEMQRARELDPLEPMIHALSSQVAVQARDFAAALDHARQAVVLDPEFWVGHVMKGQALAQLKQDDAALDALRIAARLSNQNSKTLALQGYVLGRMRRRAEAAQILAGLEETARSRYVPPVAMALVHLGLGEDDKAFEWLEKALAARDVHLMFLTTDPKWDPLRSDHRFDALMTRCGFTLNADRREAVP